MSMVQNNGTKLGVVQMKMHLAEFRSTPVGKYLSLVQLKVRKEVNPITAARMTGLFQFWTLRAI
jgi:hypothetical protein